MNRIICADCLPWMQKTKLRFKAAFLDWPDNIDLGYKDYNDKLSIQDYINRMKSWTLAAIKLAPTVWISFNSKWTVQMGAILNDFLTHDIREEWEVKCCVQIFTFGQHNRWDFGNNHRPLWRIKRKDAQVYPNQIRTASWRQLNNDPRANPKGRVPGDVFDFPRVTGNSLQRRDWCPTQLHEGLVERALLSCTRPGDKVLDPFAGTGTTLRVCKRIKRQCTLVEISPDYCRRIAKEHRLKVHYAKT